MSDQELSLLEERVEHLIKHCEQVQSERDELFRQTQEQALQLKEFEEKLVLIEDQREKVRVRVSDLLRKIEEADVLSEQGDTEEGSVDFIQTEEHTNG